MALPASGPISFNDINVELGVSGTTQASLGQTSYRTLAGVASGQISMSNFYGKSNAFSFTISTNQTNANLRSLAVSAGWNQSTKVIATINSGVYVSSNSTGTPGLTVNGSFPGGVDLINNGFIIGMGGAGGAGSATDAYAGTQIGGAAGSVGGLALSVSSAVSITNNGTIGGGGGGGGGGQGSMYVTYVGKDSTFWWAGGGGGGGGRSGAAANSAAGAGGVNNATGLPNNYNGNAGSVGTSAGAGAGGTGTSSTRATSGAGGSGGAWGSAGGSGSSPSPANNIGGWPSRGPFGGGSGGAAISGNSNITWVATGTRLGSIS